MSGGVPKKRLRSRFISLDKEKTKLRGMSLDKKKTNLRGISGGVYSFLIQDACEDEVCEVD